VEYQAKTNSFLGPPFAKTTKVQRALQISKKLLVLEIKTTLSDIPFSNRFYIMERWLVTSESHPTTPEEDVPNNSSIVSNHKKGGKPKKQRPSSSASFSSNHHHHHSSKKMTSCSYLTVTSQVIFTQDCPFEATVVKESTKQISEICMQWNKMAQEGLKRTEETRRLRLREEEEEEQLAATTTENEGASIKNETTPTTASSSSSSSSQKDAAYEADESIEIQHMGRRNSWVAGDAYPPMGGEEGSKDKRSNQFSSSWKGISTRRKSTTAGRRSLSRSLSNLIKRRSSTTIASSTSPSQVTSCSLERSVAVVPVVSAA
jgi:hypothetical protein